MFKTFHLLRREHQRKLGWAWSWRLMAQVPAQARNRASKTGRDLQWWDTLSQNEMQCSSASSATWRITGHKFILGRKNIDDDVTRKNDSWSNTMAVSEELSPTPAWRVKTRSWICMLRRRKGRCQVRGTTGNVVWWDAGVRVLVNECSSQSCRINC